MVGIALLFGAAFYGVIPLAYLIQRAWDQRAVFIFKAVRDGKKPRFLLYLRPFSSDSGWVDFNSGRPWWYSSSRLFEPRLALALEKYAPVIALMRDPDDYDFGKSQIKYPDLFWADGHLQGFGVGRFSIDSDKWKQTVKLLMQACIAILIVPLPSDRLLWELNKIKDRNLLSKCVFVMPPESNIYLIERKWKQAVKAFLREGIELPVYERYGLLFTNDDSGVIRETKCFSRSNIFLRYSIKQLLAQRSINPG